MVDITDPNIIRDDDIRDFTRKGRVQHWDTMDVARFIAKTYQGAYGEGPFPWRPDWPWQTLTPRCCVGDCDRPSFFKFKSQLFNPKCRHHAREETSQALDPKI